MDIQTYETWLWDAACAICGPVEAPKLKDYILPLIFLERLSEVFEDEVKRCAQEFGGEKQFLGLLEQECQPRPVRLARFYLECRTFH